VFTRLEDGLRICLHKFNACDRHEAFAHPHPWPGAFMVMEGEYRMEIGEYSGNRLTPLPVANFVMRKWAQYEITSRTDLARRRPRSATPGPSWSTTPSGPTT
jgi:hypothetical protein